MSPSVPIASLRNVRKRYGTVMALDGLDLDLRRGELMALLGGNGAGKSTALGVLTGRLDADDGQVKLFGADPKQAAVRRRIGVMLQEARLPDTLRVSELVHQFSCYYPKPRAVHDTLALAGLSGLAGRAYGALSGGQQRRVQFALAIVGRPELVFVDEPTSGLDIEARRGFWQVIQSLRDSGTSIVLTTHYLEEADALADRVVLIANGRLLAEDTPAGLKARAHCARIRCTTKLTLAEVLSIAGVKSAEADGGYVSLRCDDSDQVLRHLLANDPSLNGIEIRPLSLEEAFLTLTGEAA
ncbi:MAG: ABC transporter ATP-binding protein [Lysobacteraceae bacterium]